MNDAIKILRPKCASNCTSVHHKTSPHILGGIQCRENTDMMGTGFVDSKHYANLIFALYDVRNRALIITSRFHGLSQAGDRSHKIHEHVSLSNITFSGYARDSSF
jgi:hypothetical protein